MASVDWSKQDTQGGMAMLRHMERHNDDLNVMYDNPDINKENIQNNYVFTYFKNEADGKYYTRGKSWGARESYKDTRARLLNQLKQIDKEKPPKRIKKDRKTFVSFYVPIPEGLSMKQEGQYVAIVYQEIAFMCGGPANCSQAYVHADEQHEYRDPKTNQIRMSLKHVQMLGLAYTKEHGVNMKNFCTRANMVRLNNRIHYRAQQLGIEFMTGAGVKSRETVEQLKAASFQAEINEKMNDIMFDVNQIIDKYEEMSAAEQAIFLQSVGAPEMDDIIKDIKDKQNDINRKFDGFDIGD